MKQKSITFRCSACQNERLNHALAHSTATRTDFITTALERFLDYAEQADIRNKNLFELVQDIDAQGDGPSFEQQA